MSSSSAAKKAPLAASTIAALGIVFGDIGTSPLYAFRECFGDPGQSAPINPANLTGAASLIIWALTLVISLKYIFIILRLDNKGEGGILALSTLIRACRDNIARQYRPFILICGLIGASLIYADGILTPAISVLSAVEGLAISAPSVAHWTVPIATGILLALFGIQQFGTAKVGLFFGPIVLLWFGTIAILGVIGIASQPHVLMALSPSEGISFLFHEWRHAMPLLAAVFLAVTGGEALYADLGHFGTRPIRFAWFSVVMPALVLNYLGQAALLSADPTAIRNPFFLLAPEFLRFPLTILATCAAVVASQALISGAFSLTAQAVQISIIPRVRIQHTSTEEIGQVYVPSVNWLFATLCILLILSFKTSTALAGAYGVAISLTMIITTILFYFAARAVWGWKLWQAGILAAVFIILDSLFLLANLTKIQDGGWLPLTIATIVSLLMLTWLWGRKRLGTRVDAEALEISTFTDDLEAGKIHRVKGMAVYLSGRTSRVPPALLHNLKHNQVAHQQILILHVTTIDEPHVPHAHRLSCETLSNGVYRVALEFGFADTPNIPLALQAYLPQELDFEVSRTTYFLGNESYCVGREASLLDRIRLGIFATMTRNASPATAHFQLPPNRVVELGGQVTLC